jgi:hypothetical protein
MLMMLSGNEMVVLPPYALVSAMVMVKMQACLIVWIKTTA